MAVTTTPDKSEILPCPFCGSEPAISEPAANNWNTFSITCEGCPLPLRPMASISESREEAIAAWNRRASSRPPADQVSDMVERVARAMFDDELDDTPRRDREQAWEQEKLIWLKNAEAAIAALQTVPASREVGELRELLVEAQRHVADLAALPCEAVGPENAESCSCDPCRARSLNERIDFALKASGEE